MTLRKYQSEAIEKTLAAIAGFPSLSDNGIERAEMDAAEADVEEIEASLRRRARAIVASIAGGHTDAWADLEVNQERIKAISRIEY